MGQPRDPKRRVLSLSLPPPLPSSIPITELIFAFLPFSSRPTGLPLRVSAVMATNTISIQLLSSGVLFSFFLVIFFFLLHPTLALRINVALAELRPAGLMHRLGRAPDSSLRAMIILRRFINKYITQQWFHLSLFSSLARSASRMRLEPQSPPQGQYNY